MASYIVYGIDVKGGRNKVTQTRSAKAARTMRDEGNNSWVRFVVYGPDGELTVAELNRLADIDHNYV